MRHAASVQELPIHSPLYIFGAGAGGDLLLSQLRLSGIRPHGFVDDTRVGYHHDIPILSVSKFLGEASADTAILIASQHWRAIGRKLGLGRMMMIDVSPMLRIFQRERCSELARQARGEMADALTAATGLQVEEILSHFPKSALECEIQRRVVEWVKPAPGLAPFFLVGEGLATAYLSQLMENYPGLYLAGHVGGVRDGFLNLVDVCPLEAFLAEADASENPLILFASENFESLAERFRENGFNRLVDMYPLLADHLTEHLPPQSAAIAAQPLATVVLDGPEDRRFLDALRQAQGEFIAVSLTGQPPQEATLQIALAALAADDRVGAVVDDADGSGFTLADLLFAATMPRSSLWVLRTKALVDIGLFDSTWTDCVAAFECWVRMACDHPVICVPGTAPPVAPSVRSIPEIAQELIARVAVLRRMFSVIGFFGVDEALWQQCFISQFTRSFNEAFAHRQEILAILGLPDAGTVMRPITLPLPAVAVYDATAQAFERRGQIGHAMAIWDRVIGRTSAAVEGLACQAFLKSPDSTPQSQLERQNAWARRHANCPWRGWDGPLPGRQAKLRVGYICAFGSSSYFEYQVLPLLKAHDRSRYEVFCYVDCATAKIHAAADMVRAVGGLDDDDFAALVRSDGIHILVEVTGFSPGHRYGAMAERCAPVQISYVNHTGTCAVPNLDYCLADAIAVPPEMDCWFTESVWRLPGSFFCFDFGEDVFPDVTPPPTLSTGTITFGCFGAGSKINDRLIALWAEILRRLPDSRLVLCNASLSSIANRLYLARRFAQYGIAPRQLDLRPGTDREAIKYLYADIDISLDTWPYCGGNTIAESLHCGVPVVTVIGETFAARYGASLLTASGCAALIATSHQDYIAKAVALAQDRDALVHYRHTLRDMVRSHGFSDSRRFTAKLERAYEDMVARPLRLPVRQTNPEETQRLENENRQLRTELKALARSVTASRQNDIYGLGTAGGPGQLGYFLVTSWGHSASIWLAGSLNLHDGILCNCGIRHPIDSFLRYPLNQDGAAWMERSTPEMFRYGVDEDRIAFFTDILTQTGHPAVAPPPRESQLLGSYVLDELEMMADTRGYSVLGNVHGLILPQLARDLRANPGLFKERRVPIANLIRHPIPRTESAIKATVHYHMDALKVDIDRLIASNLTEFRAMENKFKIDLADPRVRAVLHVYRQGFQNVVWADEIKEYPGIKHILMERLQNEPGYYTQILSLLTQGRIRVSDDDLDKVYSPENMGSGPGLFSSPGVVITRTECESMRPSSA